jgi:hypothetical protein
MTQTSVNPVLMWRRPKHRLKSSDEVKVRDACLPRDSFDRPVRFAQVKQPVTSTADVRELRIGKRHTPILPGVLWLRRLPQKQSEA